MCIEKNGGCNHMVRLHTVSFIDLSLVHKGAMCVLRRMAVVIIWYVFTPSVSFAYHWFIWVQCVY